MFHPWQFWFDILIGSKDFQFSCFEHLITELTFGSLSNNNMIQTWKLKMLLTNGKDWFDHLQGWKIPLLGPPSAHPVKKIINMKMLLTNWYVSLVSPYGWKISPLAWSLHSSKEIQFYWHKKDVDTLTDFKVNKEWSDHDRRIL